MRNSPPSTRDWATKHLHKLDKADVAAALRELGNFALRHPHPDVACIGHVILQLAQQRRRNDLLTEIGLVRTGGPATADAAVLLRFRDQMIRRLYDVICWDEFTIAVMRECQKKLSDPFFDADGIEIGVDDAFLQNYQRPTPRDVAKKILQRSKAYARRVDRDLDAGRCNGGPAEQILLEIAYAGQIVPKSVDQIFRIIRDLEKHPVGPLDAEPSVVQTDP